MLFAGAAHVSTVAHGALSSGAATVSVAGLLLQMVIGLGVVLAAIAVISRLVKGRGGRIGVSLGRRPALINVVGRQALGKGISLAVVKIGERAFLLGVTPNSVRQLSELSAEELSDPEPAEPASPLVSSTHWPMAGGRRHSQGQQSPTWMSTLDHLRDLTARR